MGKYEDDKERSKCYAYKLSVTIVIKNEKDEHE